MSKSPNLFLPAAGGAALILGVAYGVATNSFANSKVSVMERQVSLAETKASEAAAAAQAEVARVAEIEAKAEEIQNEARLALASASNGAIAEPAPIASARYGLGRPTHADEIAAWDVDVLPDGRGLPEGRGDVLTGEGVFADKCASCHGDFAEGVDNWPVLAGGFDTLADKDPVKTVGSYWPHLSTVWDYVHRSMPFGAAQTLEDDEVYAIVAYILYSNDLVDEDFELSRENFTDVAMHNAGGFIIDDRSASEYEDWRTEPCMENCKDSVQITMRASVLDVTPDEEEPMPGEDHAAATEDAATDAASETEVAAVDPELVKAGETVFKKCKACHQIGEGAKNRSGPQLNGVVGRAIASVDGFKYSKAMKAADITWTREHLDAWLADPKALIPGSVMLYKQKDPEIRQKIIEFVAAAQD